MKRGCGTKRGFGMNLSDPRVAAAGGGALRSR